MASKKFFFRFTLALSLLFSLKILSMNEKPNENHWKNFSDLGTSFIEYFKLDECLEKDSSTIQSFIEAMERIKKFVDEDEDFFYEDLLFIYKNKNCVDEKYFKIRCEKFIKKAEDKILQEYNQKKETPTNNLVSAKKLRCPNCWFFPDEKTPTYPCPICLSTFFCNKKCYENYKLKHETICRKNILESALKNIGLSLNNTNKDNKNKSNLKDIFIAESNKKNLNPNQINLLNKAKEITKTNNNTAKSENSCCSFCETQICNKCNIAHDEKILCNNANESRPKFITCDLCMAPFCDEKCLKSHSINVCKKNILKLEYLKKHPLLLDNNSNNLSSNTKYEKTCLNTFLKKNIDLKSIFSTQEFITNKINDLEIIWLKTVDDSNPYIVGCLSKIYTLQKLEQFNPDKTSGSQALRNANIMERFLRSENLNINLIDELKNNDKARTFIEESIETNTPTSSLSAKDIENFLGVQGQANNILVLDSIVELENSNNPKEKKNLKEKNILNFLEMFKKEDTCFKTIIIKKMRFSNNENNNNNPSSLSNQPYNGNTLQSQICYFDSDNCKKYKSYENRWYALSLIKKNNQKICFIIDTDTYSEKDYEENLKIESLCKYVFNSDKDALKNEIKKLSKVSMFMENNFLTSQASNPADIDLPEDLSKELLRSAPEKIKTLVEKLKNMEKTNDKVYILSGLTGAGKTDTAKMVAKETNRKLLFIKSSLLGDQFKNSEKIDIEKIIYPIIQDSIINDKSYIIVFDEFDSINTKDPKSNSNNDIALNNAMNQIIDTIEKNKDCNIITFLTTNYLDNINKTIKSRAKDNIIRFTKASKYQRKKIISYLILKNKKLAKKEKYINVETNLINEDIIAKKTYKFEARNLSALVDSVFEKEIHDTLEGTPKSDKINKLIDVQIETDNFYKTIDSMAENIGALPTFNKDLLNFFYPTIKNCKDSFLNGFFNVVGSVTAKKIINATECVIANKILKQRLNKETKKGETQESKETKKGENPESKETKTGETPESIEIKKGETPELIEIKRKIEKNKEKFEKVVYGIEPLNSEIKDYRARENSDFIKDKKILEEEKTKLEEQQKLNPQDTKIQEALNNNKQKFEILENQHHTAQTGHDFGFDLEQKINKTIENNNYISLVPVLDKAISELQGKNDDKSQKELEIKKRERKLLEEKHMAVQNGHDLSYDSDFLNQQAIYAQQSHEHLALLEEEKGIIKDNIKKSTDKNISSELKRKLIYINRQIKLSLDNLKARRFGENLEFDTEILNLRTIQQIDNDKLDEELAKQEKDILDNSWFKCKYLNSDLYMIQNKREKLKRQSETNQTGYDTTTNSLYRDGWEGLKEGTQFVANVVAIAKGGI